MSLARPDIPRRLRLALVGVAALGASVVPDALRAQEEALPFMLGERLTFRGRVSRVGDIGAATMWVEGPVDVRGSSAWLLRFDYGAKVGFVKAEDRTASWLDAGRFATLRFAKHERHPVSRHEEQVELYPRERRWTAADGGAGESPTDAPLDELSFMYFLRTLPLVTGAQWRFDRHFDAARNPTLVKVSGREVVATRLGDFQTFVVEMRVRDPRRYKGEGVIRINLTDDACRLPVRIESRMPVVGQAILTLDSHSRPAGECSAAPTLTAR